MKTGEQVYWVDPEGVSSGIYTIFGVSEETYELWNGFSQAEVPQHECIDPKKLVGVTLDSNMFWGTVEDGEELEYFRKMEESEYDLAGFKNLVGTKIFTRYWSGAETFGETLEEYLLKKS